MYKIFLEFIEPEEENGWSEYDPTDGYNNDGSIPKAWDLIYDLGNRKLYTTPLNPIVQSKDKVLVKLIEPQVLRTPEFNDLIKQCKDLDAERRHTIMDQILVLTLRGMGPELQEGLDIYEGVRKWYA